MHWHWLHPLVARPGQGAAGWLERMPLPELRHCDGWQGPAAAAGEALAEAIRAVQPFPR